MLELGRWRPMWIETDLIGDCSDSWASVRARDAVAIVYSPGVKSTDTWVVPWGLMGAVLASVWEPPALEMSRASAWLAWLVTMKTTGPAPTEAGGRPRRG